VVKQSTKAESMKTFRDIKTVITILIALIATASTAHAQTYFGSANTVLTCQTYLQTKDTDPEIGGAYDLWAFGYVSGLNVTNYHIKKVDLLNSQTKPDLLRFIKTFCSDSSASSKLLKDAVDSYWDRLSNPKPVE
jgi:hypothetical protein